MATITGFTAERMLQIENSTVVDGNIQNGRLILLRRDNTPIDAGPIIGPTGPAGPPGPGPIVGEIRLTVMTTVPTGWFLMNGQTITNAATLYATLFNGSPTSWRSGANLVLPNLARRHLIGAGGTTAVGATGGDDNIRLATGHLPAHSHGPGNLGMGSAGTHSHGPTVSGYQYVVRRNGVNNLPSAVNAWNSTYGLTFADITGSSGGHTHPINAGATANAGSGTAYEHRPQFIAINTMIFAGY